MQILHLLLERRTQLAFAEDHQMRIGHLVHHQRDGVEQVPLALVCHQRPHVHDHRHAVRQPELDVDVERRQPLDLGDVDAVVHHVRPARAGNAVVDEDVANGARRGDEARHLAILPARERVAAQVEVHAPGRHQRGGRSDGAERQGRRRHRHRVRIVRVHEVGPVVADDARQPPRRAQVDLVARRQSDQIRPFGGALVQLTLRVRDEHRSVPAFAQPQDGQERLLLSAAPGPGGVDVEAEHSSHSFANFRPT